MINEEPTIIRQGYCPKCGSSDANTYYSDGGVYCFKCHTYSGTRDPMQFNGKEDQQRSIPSEFLQGSLKPLPKRKISLDTCKKFGYITGKDDKGIFQAGPCYNEAGELVAQSIRRSDKKFSWIGNPKECLPLFGQQLCRGSNKRIIITEGIIDCLTVSEALGNKWDVVSLINGAGSAKKDLSRASDFLDSYDQVVLCFDMDDPGRQAVKDASHVVSPGKLHIVHLPLKDANEMLVQGRKPELINCLWSAKPYRPDGIVQLSDLIDQVLTPIPQGIPWWDDRLTDLTFGRRTGELYAIGAGTGIGKTDWLLQQIAFDINSLDKKVGVFFFEQQPVETIKRLCSKETGKGFFLPQDAGDWTLDELKEATGKLDQNENLYLYDHFGCTEWSTVKSQVRYMAVNDGVKIFYIDNLTALATGSDKPEKEILEEIMSDMGGLVKELDIMIHLVSHLSTPDKTPHEEGGRVMIRHFKGSRSIGFWCHYMFGIERNPQDSEQGHVSTLRVLKDRLTGRSTGTTLKFTYDKETFRLIPIQENFEDVFKGDETAF